jgi:hypothetical protein
MPSVMHLAEEVCAGAEIYYTGKTGGQYFKTAFILCDDYTELASKLFLTLSPGEWADTTAGGHWKGYKRVLADVLDSCRVNEPAKADRVAELQKAMNERRQTRNHFFHSAQLLDLNITFRVCVEAYCDLFEYCEALFKDWPQVASGVRNLETLVLLFRLERHALGDPSIEVRVHEVMRGWARNSVSRGRSGVQEARFPEDLHLRMCVINGSTALRDQLATVLAAAHT